MLTISKLGKKFGLSRATILYYEREGLLEPASRTANGYRWYGDREIERLKQITGFRSYGVPVRDIRELLARDSGQAHDQILRKRFAQMETEIQDLRRQQQALLAILEQAPSRTSAGVATTSNEQRTLVWHHARSRHERRRHAQLAP